MDLKFNEISTRIQMLTFHQNIQLDYKTTSPTINMLRETKKVQKTKEIYEHFQWTCHKQTYYASFTSSKEPTRERHLICDLIECEKSQLKRLEAISGIFNNIIDIESAIISRNQHISLCGLLNSITELHKNKILPVVQEENISCSRILQNILNLIEDDDFYVYVTYSMLYNSTQQWIDNLKVVLDLKSGIKEYILDGEDIIKAYKNWTLDAYNFLLKDFWGNADNIAMCMELEEKLDHLLQMIKEAKKIVCIKEVSRNNIEAIEKLYNVMEKQNILSHPCLILFPRHDLFHGYRNPIDILKLGQFVRIWNEKSMLSETSECYYNTNLFIFEHCIIYTIVINENSFMYNGHFWIKDSKFDPVLKDDKPIVLAILKSGDRRLILDNVDFVCTLMRLYDQHKNDEIDGDIEIHFHLKITSK